MLTGALGGIGRATLRRLLADGSCVAASYALGVEDEREALAVADSEPGRVSVHPLDLGDGASVERFFTAVVGRWTRIDALVNNAAVGSATVGAYADDTRVQDEVMLDINANGPLLLSRMFVDHLRHRWRSGDVEAQAPAQLVTVSSVGGGVAVFPGFRLADGMSKAAVAFMTRQLAAEHVHTPLDVFALCPGATNTEMFRASTLRAMEPDLRERFVSHLPKRRLIEPEEVADVIAFLLEPRARILHGAVIDASMGLGSRPGLITEFDLHS